MKYRKSCANCGDVCVFDECFQDGIEVCDNWDLSLADFIKTVKSNRDNGLIKEFATNFYDKYTWKDFINEFFE